MTTIVTTPTPCGCSSCADGKKVVSLTKLSEHLGMALRDLRQVIAAGDGPPAYKPAHRAFARYYIPSADQWLASRDDTRRGAA